MSTTPISATLAQTERDAVLQAISTIKKKLPFLVDLSSDDRNTCLVCDLSSLASFLPFFYRRTHVKLKLNEDLR